MTHKVVKFKTHYPPYNAGEGAAFEPHVAEALVKAGVADNIPDEPDTNDQSEPAAKKVRKPRLDDIVEK